MQNLPFWPPPIKATRVCGDSTNFMGCYINARRQRILSAFMRLTIIYHSSGKVSLHQMSPAVMKGLVVLMIHEKSSEHRDVSHYGNGGRKMRKYCIIRWCAIRERDRDGLNVCMCEWRICILNRMC